MKPNQAADNPYDILTQRNEWVRFEFLATRGDTMGLHDYAKRYELMHAIIEDCQKSGVEAIPESVVNAMAYLLRMEKAIQ